MELILAAQRKGKLIQVEVSMKKYNWFMFASHITDQKTWTANNLVVLY